MLALAVASLRAPAFAAASDAAAHRPLQGLEWMRAAAAIAAAQDGADPGAPALYVATTGSDSADGSAAHPWRTLRHAAEAVVPGATVHVRAGVYPSGMIEPRVNGRPDARIRFVSDSTWGAQIRVTPVRLYHYAWRQVGACTDVVGFDVSGDGFTGIDVVGDDVHVLHDHVHDLPNVGSRGAAGILNEQGQRAWIHGNVIHGIGNPDSTNGLVHGIYLSSGSRNAVVDDNIVFGNQDAGICSYHTAEAGTIANNTIFGNGNWGVEIGGANDSTADHFVVIDNIVFDNAGSGLAELGLSGSHNRFDHNLVFGNRIPYDIHTSPMPAHDVNADPQFVRYRRDGGGDYRLARGSPCIGAGAPAGTRPADFTGFGRADGRIDLGAIQWR